MLSNIARLSAVRAPVPSERARLLTLAHHVTLSAARCAGLPRGRPHETAALPADRVRAAVGAEPAAEGWHWPARVAAAAARALAARAPAHLLAPFYLGGARAAGWNGVRSSVCCNWQPQERAPPVCYAAHANAGCASDRSVLLPFANCVRAQPRQAATSDVGDYFRLVAERQLQHLLATSRELLEADTQKSEAERAASRAGAGEEPDSDTDESSSCYSD